jgi:hypothetical protein
MNCEDYMRSYPRYWNQGPVNNEYASEQAAWYRHQHTCVRCRSWSREQYCLSRGVDPQNHCCLELAYNISAPIETVHQGRNHVLTWIRCWDEYHIPISYSGYKSTIIRYCPWCGATLPESKQANWFQTLYRLGYSDPGSDDIPEEFTTDKWWRQ